jgi:hypothetical protein
MIASFVEDLLLLLVGVVPRTQAELVRISVLAAASAGLLFTEYRLSVANLVASISAMLFAGVARALWKMSIRYRPGEVSYIMDQPGRFVSIQALVGLIWVLAFWTGDRIFTFDHGNISLLAVNAVASSLSLTLGRSILFPMDDASAQVLGVPVQYLPDRPVVLVVTGIVGCFSALLVRRSYTNVFQLCCFLIAVLCIGGKGTVDTASGQSQAPSITYERVNISPEPAADDSDATSLPEEIGSTRVPAFVSSLAGDRPRRYLLGISVALLWMAYGILNFTERRERHDPTLLDRNYVSEVPVEVVLSMYKEPVEEVSKLISNLRSMPTLSDAHFTIYIKNSEADNENIRQKVGADGVVTLPNIGREGETYLNHILNRWDSLARQTIFLQADIHNPREFYPHIKNYYSRLRTGFLSLGWSGTVCNCRDCGDKFFWQDNAGLVPRTYNGIYNSTDCDKVLLSSKGQFIVSAARIRGIDKEIYHDLWQAFVDDKSWAHQPEYLQGRPDSMSAADFGYTLERMWSLLFRCSNMDVAWKCPSLLSGWRIGGDIGDCQCFDD